MTRRVIWFVLDSFGIGGAPDAKNFGDEGSNTLGHLADWFLKHQNRPLRLPNLERLGLGEAFRLVHGRLPAGWLPAEVEGGYAAATEISTGKDTPSGHWEMAGVPVTWDWAYFADESDCFPSDKIEEILTRAGLDGSLAHCHASGTEIIARLGAESVKTGYPIFYTSADSVFQIAAHEKSFGLNRLYEVCTIAREVFMDPLVGRVIARPFVGIDGDYTRTANRKDYAIKPPKPTILEKVKDSGKIVTGVGKVGDIFAHCGFTHEWKASGHPELWKKSVEALEISDLVFTNFVDFDMLYGHRRDPLGYGLALEEWDSKFSEFLSLLREDDLLLITADHGNDPTWKGSDHTRERVPVLVSGKGFKGSYGIRETFADLSVTVADLFSVEMDAGNSLI